MKAIAKRMSVFFCILVFTITALQTPMEVQAAPSASTVKSAYVNYLKKQINNAIYPEDLQYYLYDFNKDGTKELVVSYSDGGAHGGATDVYTYRNKKIVSLLKNVSEVGYVKGKKFLVAYSSGGAYDYNYTAYNIKKGKLVKVNKYACVGGVYKKDSKKITKSVFDAFTSKVKYDLGSAKEIKGEYYSPKTLGFSVYGSSGKTYTCIDKVANNKVYYYTYQLKEGMRINKSKVKTAKITNNTKFYYGNTDLLFSGTLKGDSMDTKKWVMKLSKKQFIKKMETYDGGLDQIFIKNGKVQKVIIHVRVAD